MTGGPFDVVVIGEILLEITTDSSVEEGVPARLGFSGDALNVAAAAAAAGASVGLAAVVSDDELGDAVAARLRQLGIAESLLRRRAGQQGMYLNHSDPNGERGFFYARRGSVGSLLSPADLDEAAIADAGAVVVSGIAGAISPSARETVVSAARTARRFAYDPNYRPRLTTAVEAAALLRKVARFAWLVTPSYPVETERLLGVADPVEAGRRLRSLGARNVAVTCGARGTQLVGEQGEAWVDAFAAPRVVDQTGAGDALLGTTVARAVLGDDLVDALTLGAAAAALTVGSRGGAAAVPELSATRALVETRKEARL